MPSHSSNASPMPFPFLPIVLDSPQTSSARSSVPSSDASQRTSAARGKSRTAQRGCADEAAQPPSVEADGHSTLRVEVARSIAPGCLTLLGAIIR